MFAEIVYGIVYIIVYCVNNLLFVRFLKGNALVNNHLFLRFPLENALSGMTISRDLLHTTAKPLISGLDQRSFIIRAIIQDKTASESDTGIIEKKVNVFSLVLFQYYVLRNYDYFTEFRPQSVSSSS